MLVYKHIIRFCTVILFLLGLIIQSSKSFAQADSTTKKIDIRLLEMALSRTWTPIMYEDFTVQYPSDWILDTSRRYGTCLMMMTYQENETDSFTENFTIMVMNQNKSVDFSEYIKNSIKGFQNLNTGYQQEESSFLQQNEFPYHKHIFTYTENNKNQRQEQYTFLRGNTIYILTLTTQKEKFDFYKYVGEYILNSFTLNSIQE